MSYLGTGFGFETEKGKSVGMDPEHYICLNDSECQFTKYSINKFRIVDPRLFDENETGIISSPDDIIEMEISGLDTKKDDTKSILDIWIDEGNDPEFYDSSYEESYEDGIMELFMRHSIAMNSMCKVKNISTGKELYWKLTDIIAIRS